MEVLFIFPLIITVWVAGTYLDKKRIRDHFNGRGDSVVSVQWRLFGKGWVSEGSKEGGGNRIYEVEYRDTYGNLRHVWCKTAMLSGVFLADDEILEATKVEGRPMTAEEKVALLEDEVRRLRASK